MSTVSPSDNSNNNTSTNTVNSPFTPPPSTHTPSPSSSQLNYPFSDVSRPTFISSRPSTSGISSTGTSNSRPGSRHGPELVQVNRWAAASRQREAFTSPPARPPVAVRNSALSSAGKQKYERPKSTMLSDSVPISKPWLDEKKDPLARIAYLTTYGVMFLGIVASAVRIYFGYKSIPLMTGNLCLVLDEDFSSGEDGVFGQSGKFFREVDMGGFGNGEFEMTTSSENNSFVKNGMLHIVPTLTSDIIGSAAVLNGYTYNLTDCTYNITQSSGYTSTSCTVLTPCEGGGAVNGSTGEAGAGNTTTNWDAYYQACSGVSNSSTGAIINPVQSARLTTRYSASIKFGKVEIKAKLPTGDWLWPALWMLPTDSVYGSWPLSGEIDIMESRGNSPLYPGQGSNYVRGSLNWGPLVFLNAVAKTFGFWSERWTAYNLGFHTYTLEWDENFMRISVDSRLQHLLNVAFNVPFFQRGDFPPVVQNGSGAVAVQNPWINGTKAAPFDQSFYLIMDVSVGGTNGWFPDNLGGKPWLDGSPTAMRDFAMAQDKWYPTWPQNVEDRAMIIDSVKMWQKC